MRLLPGAATLLVSFATIASCGEVVPTLESGARCSLNSDCKSPLVCNFERCRSECLTSRDCSGKLCVRGEGSNVCQLGDESECTHDSQCVGTQVCGLDRRCRDMCANGKDCISDLACVSGVCARPDELVNGKLRARDPSDSGVSCTYASDCPPELVCLNGRCDIECLGDKDCVVGWTCKTLTTGGDGRCYPNTQTGDASSDVADATGPAQGLASAVVTGNAFACAILVGGKVKCWGANISGQLGLGSTANRGDGPGEMGDALPYVDLGTGRTATTVAAGSNHACAVLDNGRVKCWGSNDSGQLGLGDLLSRGDGAGEMGDALPYVDLGTGRTATKVAAGRLHTCALLDNGRIKCWGASAFGQVGLGTTDTRGGGAGEMGDALPFVDLGSGRTAKALVANNDFSCALLDNDRIKCWGQNSTGQLGLGDAQPRGDNAGEMGDALPFVDLGTGRTVKSVAAGTLHACAVLDNERVKCWGQNSGGELGLGDTFPRGTGAGEMGDALPDVDLGAGRSAKAVSAGDRNTCAVLDNQLRIKCWGVSDAGQLGRGDTTARGDGPGEMGDALILVDLGGGRSTKALAVNYSFACALIDNDRIKCWGANTSGQLGLDDTQNRGDGPGEMANALPNVKLVGQ